MTIVVTTSADTRSNLLLTMFETEGTNLLILLWIRFGILFVLAYAALQ